MDTNMISHNYDLSNKHYCSNCNKVGHVIKKCSKPIISCGIFCFKLDNNLLPIFNKNINHIHYHDLDNNNIHISNILKFQKYNKLIQFLLVKRKHSLNYIDFIRGKYNQCDTNKLVNMFNYMSKHELEMIINTNDFNKLWDDLWGSNAHLQMYNNEMKSSMNKFNSLKKNKIIKNISSECNPYDTPEWEIPKGRKDSNETNIECAVREFKEETLLDKSDYNILTSVNPIHDTFVGTNNKEYTHVFYIGMANQNKTKLLPSNNEIEEIRWCNWDEMVKLIRPYNNNKINILTNLFIFIINICETNVNKNIYLL